MLELRKSADRGYGHHAWLETYHSFSFATYYDPAQMDFGPLRVINEDIIEGGHGFTMHGHNNMEIVTYVLAGALEHQDSMGHTSVLQYGDVQRMSAGHGLKHSERNHSASEPLHLLQIWLTPNAIDIAPSYQEKHFDVASKQHQLRLIASPDGRKGSLSLAQDALLFAGILAPSDRIHYRMAVDRIAYLHVARGTLCVNGVQLLAGDALKIGDEDGLLMDKALDAEILLFDMALTL